MINKISDHVEVLLILSSLNIRHIFAGLGLNLPICFMILIVGVILVPFGWMKSPADMP